MPHARVNDVNLYYEITGDAQERLVLVHGSWVDHHMWGFVVPLLAESLRVLTYDRRGHSQSEPPSGEGTLDQDVDDLSALIEHLDFAPAVLVGNSYGAIVSLGFAARRPDLIQRLSIHEPPLFGLLADDSTLQPRLEYQGRQVGVVLELIRQGETAEAAERFVELAIGPGAWTQFPPPLKQTFITNAYTFFEEFRDPTGPRIDLEALSLFSRPTLLTHGEQNSLFPAVISRIEATIPGSEVYTFPGAGHVPHFTHPHEFVQIVRAFARQPALTWNRRRESPHNSARSHYVQPLHREGDQERGDGPGMACSVRALCWDRVGGK
jgi:pimeloyl-ACP methyl ester carboxylesterase